MATDTRTDLVIPADPFAKPTEEQALAELQRLTEIWEDAIAWKKKAWSFYVQQNRIWHEWEKRNPRAPERPEYHSGLGVALIDTAVNAQLAYKPIFTRPHLNDDETTHAADDRIELAADSMFTDIFTWNLNIPSKLNGKQLQLYNNTQAWIGLDNEVIQKPVKMTGEEKEDFDRREWDWESQHLTVNPIKLEVPPPGEVLMDPLKKIPDVSIRHKTIKAYQLHELTIKKNRQGSGDIWPMGINDPYQDIKIVERWTSRWVLLLIDGVMFYVEPNPIWIQPASQCWSGDVETPPGEDFNPAFWVKQSMMFRVMPALEFRDQSFVAQHTVLMDHAYAQTLYDGNPAEAAMLLKSGIVPGKTTDWAKMPQTEFPNQLFSEKAELDKDIEQSTHSKQAAGFREQGVRTATEYLSLAQNVNRAFQANVEQLGSMYTILAQNGLRISYRLSQEYPEEWQEISFGDNKLKVADLGTPPRFHIQARFEQVDVVTALQEKAAVDADLEAGRIDEDTWAKKSGYENFSEIKKNRVKDRVRQMPELVAEQEIIALRELQYEELADRKEQEATQRRLAGSLVDPRGSSLQGSRGQPISPPLEGTQ